jgi:phosphoesterase RecJ-like protein
MALDWTPFVDLVRQHRRFLLTTHVRPDGDGLGSMLALADALEAQGKAVQMAVASVIPPRYDFLDPAKRVRQYFAPGDEYRQAEALIVLDTGTWNQLGDIGTLLRELPAPRVVIDHHLTQDELGGARLVDTSAEATGRLVYEAIGALGVPLSAGAAHCLFVALAMDTGWFRHNNTTPATFHLAEQLVEAGARPTQAYESLFEQSTAARLRLTGRVLSRLEVVHGGRICLTEIHRDDYEQTGAQPQDSEDLVNYTRSVAGVEVGLFFMEQPRGGVKVSFRARQIDVARIAEQFQGGGHRLAAGAIVDRPLAEAKAEVLKAVIAALPGL